MLLIGVMMEMLDLLFVIGGLVVRLELVVFM